MLDLLRRAVASNQRSVQIHELLEIDIARFRDPTRKKSRASGVANDMTCLQQRRRYQNCNGSSWFQHEMHTSSRTESDLPDTTPNPSGDCWSPTNVWRSLRAHSALGKTAKRSEARLVGSRKEPRSSAKVSVSNKSALSVPWCALLFSYLATTTAGSLS